MIVINDLTDQVGARALYTQASLHIKPKDKIGLVGLNRELGDFSARGGSCVANSAQRYCFYGYTQESWGK